MAIKPYPILAGLSLVFAAFSASSNYKLNTYSVGGGGGGATSSTNYSAEASIGETAGTKSTSANFAIKSGAIEAQQANVPTAPTLSNGGGSYYDKLNFVINTASNPSDAKFSVAVSTTSNFLVANYVQADGTLGATAVYQTYSQWGSGSGTDAIGLSPSTTYYFKVDATQGKYTPSGYGPSANIATVASPAATISFALTPTTINMGSLVAGNLVTSPSSISLTFSTNASHGGTIYMSGSNTGLVSANSGGYNVHVTAPSGDLSSLSEGFGLQNLSASSPMVSQSPYNGAGNVVGAIYTTFQPVFSSTTSVSSGTSTATLKAKTSTLTPSATDYSDDLTFIVAASY